jgi:hypothetical protein
MRWVNQVRQKNSERPTQALTKLTKGGVVSAAPTLVSFVRTSLRGSVLFQRPLEVRSTRVISPRDEVIRVAYQVIWYDYDLRDGVYAPEQLRRARKRIKRGPVRHYVLRWPGGRPEPVATSHATRVRALPHRW